MNFMSFTLKPKMRLPLDDDQIEIPNYPIQKQIGSYSIGKEIGSGAFGKVVLGTHILTNETVAIKILDKIMLSETPEDLELLEQEISILKIVRHKNIVQLYEILETPQHLYIVMEYCEGKDLMDYILTKTKLSEMESLKFFQQLINALFYLHGQNITHRDIKIDNMLLDSKKNLKLVDFGLSTKYTDDKLLNQPCGTVVYAAPEVLDGREYHGMLADVWSSGIVLYGMLSGYLPFCDQDDEINKQSVLKGEIEIPSEFSPLSKDLLMHMLDMNPMTRYTLNDIQKHPWFRLTNYHMIPGVIIGYNKVPIDERILNMIESLGLNKDKVRGDLERNKFNSGTSMYYLIVNKFRSKGFSSISDLCSKEFMDYIYDETNLVHRKSVSLDVNVGSTNGDDTNNCINNENVNLNGKGNDSNNNNNKIMTNNFISNSNNNVNRVKEKNKEKDDDKGEDSNKDFRKSDLISTNGNTKKSLNSSKKNTTGQINSKSNYNSVKEKNNRNSKNISNSNISNVNSSIYTNKTEKEPNYNLNFSTLGGAYKNSVKETKENSNLNININNYNNHKEKSPNNPIKIHGNNISNSRRQQLKQKLICTDRNNYCQSVKEEKKHRRIITKDQCNLSSGLNSSSKNKINDNGLNININNLNSNMGTNANSNINSNVYNNINNNMNSNKKQKKEYMNSINCINNSNIKEKEKLKDKLKDKFNFIQPYYIKKSIKSSSVKEIHSTNVDKNTVNYTDRFFNKGKEQNLNFESEKSSNITFRNSGMPIPKPVYTIKIKEKKKESLTKSTLLNSSRKEKTSRQRNSSISNIQRILGISSLTNIFEKEEKKSTKSKMSNSKNKNKTTFKVEKNKLSNNLKLNLNYNNMNSGINSNINSNVNSINNNYNYNYNYSNSNTNAYHHNCNTNFHNTSAINTIIQKTQNQNKVSEKNAQNTVMDVSKKKYKVRSCSQGNIFSVNEALNSKREKNKSSHKHINTNIDEVKNVTSRLYTTYNVSTIFPKTNKMKVCSNIYNNANSNYNSIHYKVDSLPNEDFMKLYKDLYRKKNVDVRHLDSSAIHYRKQSPILCRDLSYSPNRAMLNEKNRLERVPWRYKKKGIELKQSNKAIYKNYKKKIENNHGRRLEYKKKYKFFNGDTNYNYHINMNLNSNINSNMISTSNLSNINNINNANNLNTIQHINNLNNLNNLSNISSSLNNIMKNNKNNNNHHKNNLSVIIKNQKTIKLNDYYVNNISCLSMKTDNDKSQISKEIKKQNFNSNNVNPSNHTNHIIHNKYNSTNINSINSVYTINNSTNHNKTNNSSLNVNFNNNNNISINNNNIHTIISSNPNKPSQTSQPKRKKGSKKNNKHFSLSFLKDKRAMSPVVKKVHIKNKGLLDDDIISRDKHQLELTVSSLTDNTFYNATSSNGNSNQFNLDFYEGPIDINCINTEASCLEDAAKVFIKKLNKNGVRYIRVKPNKFKCTKNRISFDVDIMKICSIGFSDDILYFKIKFNQAMNFEHKKIISFLLG